ncbi:unnamed protein product [Callosobruchus maculatus]|uniref:Uncharacterized protein n=1 Tax=Callosobruchus maculatus TaxID=64391 RepID=A0A653BVC0_CALMS|nr:unnamed protein product [Callosobruchus maculatus]
MVQFAVQDLLEYLDGFLKRYQFSSMTSEHFSYLERL